MRPPLVRILRRPRYPYFCTVFVRLPNPHPPCTDAETPVYLQQERESVFFYWHVDLGVIKKDVIKTSFRGSTKTLPKQGWQWSIRRFHVTRQWRRGGWRARDRPPCHKRENRLQGSISPTIWHSLSPTKWYPGPPTHTHTQFLARLMYEEKSSVAKAAHKTLMKLTAKL